MRLRIAALAVLALVGANASGGDPRESPESRFAYIRDSASPAETVKQVLAAARDRGAESVAFVLDRATFDPPAKRNEFTMVHSYAADRRAWLDAAVAASDGPRVSLAMTTSARLRGATAADAAALEQECDGDVWSLVGPSKTFLPAHKWIEAFATQLSGTHKAIVLVTCDAFPESSFRVATITQTPSGEEDRWRSKMLPEGAYWNAEEVAAVARKRGATLFVVAPEAKFGDCQLLDDIPEAPLASRPRAQPVAEPSVEPKKRVGSPLDAHVRAQMLEELSRRGLDEPAVRRAMALKDQEALNPPDDRDAGRFDSKTPCLFPRMGLDLFANTDCPSGYGVWRLARAAAATGGAYALYPFPKRRWMDECFRDATLLDALAPPLTPREKIVSAAKDDAALAAMLAAQAYVIDATPWADGSKGYGLANGGLAGWCGFELPGPEVPRRWVARRKPVNREYWLGAPAEVAAAGNRAAERYRHAVQTLEAACSDPRVAAAPRRSQANLRLCRFWFEMSLFHFESLALAGGEPLRFDAQEATAKNDYIGSWRAVRLSDCLPAYDGRVLTAWDEERYGQRWSKEPNDGYQGAFLNIGTGDPNYRAQRDVDRALANLDDRLRPRALRVIAAARDVLDHEARSPWGWSVYYSELQTYVWCAYQKKPTSGRVGSKPPPPPETPPDSSSSGATTPK